MRSLPLFTCLAALLIGCSPAPAPTDVGSPEAAVAGGAGAAPGGASAAPAPSFAAWKSRLDELLTLDLAAEVAGLPVAAADKDYIDGLPQIAFTWPSERTQEYAGMRLSKKNRVAIANIQTGVTPALFRSRFRAATESELARVDEEARRQAAERGLDSPQAAEVSDLAAVLSAVSPSEEVPGVGDVAVWEAGEHEQVLYVLLNGSSIRMTVDISDDPAANRDAAIALAQRLIQRL